MNYNQGCINHNISYYVLLLASKSKLVDDDDRPVTISY